MVAANINTIPKATAAAANLSSQSRKESIGGLEWQLKVLVIAER